VICIIKANVTIVALNATGVASRLQYFKSTDIDGANPAGNSGKPVTEKSVSVPLRILGPVHQSAVKRCDATGDCDDQQALFWVAKVNGCAAIPSGVVCPR
jgi:hypothetical protein